MSSVSSNQKFLILLALLISSVSFSLSWTVSHDWSQVKNVNLSQDQVSPSLHSKYYNPPGTILAFGGSNVPEGWLLCNGSELSRSVYGNLFVAIGTTWGNESESTFSLPDLRGAFLRGTGIHETEKSSNESYPFEGPQVGMFQNDSFQSHRVHVFTNNSIVATLNSVGEDDYMPRAGAQSGAYASYQIYKESQGGMPSVGKTSTPISDDVYGTPRTGAETRPFNAGVNYIIKY